jgi:hypothetical protein
LFYEKEFLLVSCKILEQLYATQVVAQISRQRDFGQAEPIRLAQQSMMQYVSKDSRRFSLGHAWSKTWKTQRGGSFLEPQLAAAISKSDLEVGINVRTP